MIVGREIFHREKAGFQILAKHGRRRMRQPDGDSAHPGRLRRVATNRRLPERRDFEPAQGALDAEASRASLDERNIRLDAAGQRSDADRLAGLDEADAAQGRDQIVGWLGC